jgi:hypothetical protein
MTATAAPIAVVGIGCRYPDAATPPRDEDDPTVFTILTEGGS